MGKAKRKGGLSGVSRFVFESMKVGSSSSDAPGLPLEVSPSRPTNPGDKDKEEPRPVKRRKVDESLDTVRDSWVKKYEANGLVPHYTELSEVPEHLHKYFSQRYRFFSLYSEAPGCLLDEEGWYSVTPELLANQIAERCRCDTILDAFCGVGGNAIAFAQTCQRVIALDTSSTRLALARHNAQIYGVADRIEFILADYISFAKSYQSLPLSSDSHQSSSSRKIDVVFLSPPWGGPEYLSGTAGELADKSKTSEDEHPSYSLSSIQPIHGAQLFKLTRKITKNVAYYIPRNTRLDEIGSLLDEEQQHDSASESTSDPSNEKAEKVEVEEEWMGNKLKALTCYFGGLAAGQEEMF